MASAPVHNVREHGAAGDGKQPDTLALQRAIDACHAGGGGLVYLPAGAFLTGTLILKSNVTLHLSPGAVLLGSRNIEDYKPRHLLYAQGERNIGIEGGGAIDGNGGAFFEGDWEKPKERPSPLIEIWDSQDVRIEGVTIRRAPGWALHPKNCERVKIRGVSILSEMRAVNTDGIDPDSCRNVIISDCHIEGGDDSIVLKTTRRGTGPVQPCENVAVTNCVLRSSASALKLGTESWADFRHIVFSNCVIRGSRTGIALFAKDGGRMENIRFSNITIETAPKWGQGVEWPILVDVERRTADSRPSVVRGVSFSGIDITTKGRILIEGMADSPLHDVALRDVRVRVTGWEKIEGVRKVRGGSAEDVPGNPDYGYAPAAFILANARGLSLRSVEVIWDAPAPAPGRHALWGVNLDDFSLADFRGEASVPGGKLGAVHLERSRMRSASLP